MMDWDELRDLTNAKVRGVDEQSTGYTRLDFIYMKTSVVLPFALDDGTTVIHVDELRQGITFNPIVAESVNAGVIQRVRQQATYEYLVKSGLQRVFDAIANANLLLDTVHTRNLQGGDPRWFDFQYIYHGVKDPDYVTRSHTVINEIADSDGYVRTIKERSGDNWGNVIRAFQAARQKGERIIEWKPTRLTQEQR